MTRSPIAQLIYDRRQQLGLSLRQLDERSGVRYSTINNIEHGKVRKPTESVLRGLALGLDLPLSKLRDAANSPGETEFRLPAKAQHLTAKQRRAILAMVDALLEDSDGPSDG